MSARLVKSATVNDWRTTLADTISDTSSIIGLVSTASLNPSQLQAPGVLTIDKKDTTGTLTPAKREYISFTSISGMTLYAVTRGLGCSVAQGHTLGAWIEETMSVTHWDDLLDWLEVEHKADGTQGPFSHVRQVTVDGVSGASGLRGDVVLVPGSNVSILPKATGIVILGLAAIRVAVSIVIALTSASFLAASTATCFVLISISIVASQSTKGCMYFALTGLSLMLSA
jgi:hypothetical protein